MMYPRSSKIFPFRSREKRVGGLQTFFTPDEKVLLLVCKAAPPNFTVELYYFAGGGESDELKTGDKLLSSLRDIDCIRNFISLGGADLILISDPPPPWRGAFIVSRRINLA